MPDSIKNILSSFKTELSRTSRFDVYIPAPFILLTMLDMITNTKGLTLRCEAAEMPGRALATIDRKIGTNPVFKVPYQSMYNEMNMTFIVDGDMSEKLFFDLWMDSINPTTNYNFRYPKDYVTDIAITQYDNQNEVSYRSILLNAYPLSVNQMDLDWTTDGYHKLNVVFAYTNWTYGTIPEIGKNALTQILSSI